MLKYSIKQEHIPFNLLLQIVEFGFSLLGTNAPTERTFSVINQIWIKEKSELKLDTLSYDSSL